MWYTIHSETCFTECQRYEKERINLKITETFDDPLGLSPEEKKKFFLTFQINKYNRQNII